MHNVHAVNMKVKQALIGLLTLKNLLSITLSCQGVKLWPLDLRSNALVNQLQTPAVVWYCCSVSVCVGGGERQGRQRKWWEDNIREWTGLEFTKSKRAVENREKWRKLVAKSSVVP